MSARNPAVTRAALLDDLRAHAFGLNGRRRAGPPRVGVEAEFIPLSAGTGLPCPIDGADPGSSLAFLRRYGAGRGWVEGLSPAGAPKLRLPGGGVLTFEPGGQVEYASPPFPSASALLDDLRATVVPLLDAARGEGMEWWSLGIDPVNPIERVPLRVESERYLRMNEYFEIRGPFGARMMRQTAAFQLNVDLGDDAVMRFRLLNAMAPYLTALFANSRHYAGQDTGHASYRAHVWRETDPCRTGIFGEDAGPEAYLELCLKAPAILKGRQDGAYRSFGAWVDRGEATLADWRDHLLNVYPDVRPRGYFEVRSPDAIPPEGYAAAIALVAGITCDERAARAAADALGPPDPALPQAAGEAGLRDPGIASAADDLLEIGLAGCAALGPRFLAPADLDAARAFHERRRRRAPSVQTPARTSRAR